MVPDNPSLFDLAKLENLSNRAISVCRRAGFHDLRGLIAHYQTHKHFKHLTRCGAKSSIEIEALCQKYLTHWPAIKDLPDDNPAEVYLALSPAQKADFEVYYDESVEAMCGRIKTRLQIGKRVLGIQGFLNQMFDPGFNFRNLSLVGIQTAEAMERFKREIAAYILSTHALSKDGKSMWHVSDNE